MGLNKLEYLWINVIEEWKLNTRWRLFLKNHGVVYFKIVNMDWLKETVKIGSGN